MPAFRWPMLRQGGRAWGWRANCRWSEDDAFKDGEEDLRHLENGLVAKTAEDERAELLIGEHFAEARTEGPGTGGIVRDIEEPLGRCSAFP